MIYNGVVVAYDDPDGREQFLWPSDYESLRNDHPAHPLNRAGLKKWLYMKVGSGTKEAALTAGLLEMAELDEQCWACGEELP